MAFLTQNIRLQSIILSVSTVRFLKYQTITKRVCCLLFTWSSCSCYNFNIFSSPQNKTHTEI